MHELYGGKVLVKYFPVSHIYKVSEDGGKTWESKPGVTTIGGIKDKSMALVSWATELARFHLLDLLAAGKKISDEDVYEACSLHTVKKEEAADLGTRIHAMVEEYVLWKMGKGPAPLMSDDPNVQIGFDAWIDFVESRHKVKFVDSEKLVYSRNHGFVGRTDILAEIDGSFDLLDLKSSNGLYNGVRMQTAAYMEAYMEETLSLPKSKGRAIERRWAIRVAKESEADYKVRMEKKGKSVFEPYQVFEAMNLDEDRDHFEDDFGAFLNAKGLYQWDKATDFYLLARAKK